MKNIEQYSSELGELVTTNNNNNYYANQKERHEDEDHELKKDFSSYLRGLLLIQTGFIFILIFLQGFEIGRFELDNYIFYILISGTLIESYFLVRIVVEHLFPKKNSKDNKK